MTCNASSDISLTQPKNFSPLNAIPGACDVNDGHSWVFYSISHACTAYLKQSQLYMAVSPQHFSMTCKCVLFYRYSSSLFQLLLFQPPIDSAFSSPSPLPFTQAVLADDRSSLMAMYYSWNSPSSLSKWGSNDPCDGSWTYVKCTCLHFTTFNGCGSGNFVNSVSIPPFHPVRGVLDPAVGNLVHLTYLGLSGNYIQGTIPPTLSQLTKLGIIHLSTNSFIGTIPAQLSTLVNLGVLTLDFNQLTGSIPVALSTVFSNVMAKTGYFNIYYNQWLCGWHNRFPGLDYSGTWIGYYCPGTGPNSGGWHTLQICI